LLANLNATAEAGGSGAVTSSQVCKVSVGLSQLLTSGQLLWRWGGRLDRLAVIVNDMKDKIVREREVITLQIDSELSQGCSQVIEASEESAQLAFCTCWLSILESRFKIILKILKICNGMFVGIASSGEAGKVIAFTVGVGSQEIVVRAKVVGASL
jgi:hypothetical protein